MDDATGDSWSASTLSVREALRDAIESDTRAAVATVSDVEGSAYRRPGAKRVLAKSEGDGEGEAVGAITAGCLEGPVADLAERALADGPLRETFDLTGDDDAWGFGLGCNGVIDVLVEPADGSFRPALDRVADGGEGSDASRTSSDPRSDGTRVALLTVVASEYSNAGDHSNASDHSNAGDGPDAHDVGASSHPDAPVGARTLVAADGTEESTDARPPIPDDLLAAVRDDARRFAETGRSDTIEAETDRGTAEVFVDGLEPVSELLAFGHSPDVRPVTRLARDAGFRVTVAAGRGGRADAEQFPAAHEVVATRPPDVAEVVARPADTYAVVMSHNFVDDRLALDALLDTEIPYVGLMGPRKRFEEMREAFADEGTRLSDDDLERISTPVGLDLGGGEPVQIALSVVGEALAVANDRDGGRLAHVEGPIHPRSELDSAPDTESSPGPDRTNDGED